ncbi:hypothetical protein M9H77_11578 [Catharanthus roseus]|uniref:Uncharacterized protein n=1 Tax=Catharanthus roseus TaxID=4058 RepID=A0ACC0BF11_CATRO|nr:hypothetical protein M9H77_11578 [Catharanthus roseus]
MPSYSLGLTPTSQTNPSGSRTSQMPPTPGLGFASFQSQHSSAYGFSGLYRKHPRLTKRSGRMTWTVFRLSASGIVFKRRLCDSRHPTGLIICNFK